MNVPVVVVDGDGEVHIDASVLLEQRRQDYLAARRAACPHPFAHYDPATGFITQLSSGPFAVDGSAVAEIGASGADFCAASADAYKVNLASVMEGEFGWNVCALVERAEHEKPAPPPFASLDGMRAMRNQMLSAHDAMMYPHRPMTDAQRARWAAYMQALRDLGRHTTPHDFAAAWPLRPDGVDDIAHIRAGLGLPPAKEGAQ